MLHVVITHTITIIVESLQQTIRRMLANCNKSNLPFQYCNDMNHCSVKCEDHWIREIALGQTVTSVAYNNRSVIHSQFVSQSVAYNNRSVIHSQFVSQSVAYNNRSVIHSQFVSQSVAYNNRSISDTFPVSFTNSHTDLERDKVLR